MELSRRAFVRSLGAGGAGAIAAPWIAARGREARSGAVVVPFPEERPAARGPAAAEGAAATAPSGIRLDSNENPHGPAPSALEAIRRAFGEACRYPDQPEVDLRAAAARALGVAPESVLLGCGSTEILRMAVLAFASPALPVVAADPSFEDPVRFAERIGAPVTSVPVTGSLHVDLDGMAAASKGAGLVYVCNPNNPTATIRPAGAVKDFVARVLRESPSATILVDEAYNEYVEDPSYATSIPLAVESPRVIVSRTFSKIYGMAGLRVGYAAGRPETIEAMRRHKLPSNVNVLGAAAAIASLADREYAPRQRALNRDARELTRRAFEEAGCRTVPSETNFMMVDVRRDAGEFQKACRDRGVLVGRKFPALPTHARVSIGTADEMRQASGVFRLVLART